MTNSIAGTVASAAIEIRACIGLSRYCGKLPVADHKFPRVAITLITGLVCFGLGLLGIVIAAHILELRPTVGEKSETGFLL